MSSGQYQGSQAFSHILPGRDESINPNTGSLNFSKSIIQLRGVTSSTGLKLNLIYTAGSAAAFGLPRNWALDLPYVVPQNSITFSGRTYAIDPLWSDAEGYRSGLRYMNNHGIKFSAIIPPQPLPSGEPGEYAYKLQVQDGSADYFDSLGRLLLHQDVFGNGLHYIYLDGSGGVLDPDPCLDHIVDSWGQKLQFGYQPGVAMIITGPDGAQTWISFSAAGVNLITDPVGYETKLVYSAPISTQQVITSILYPTGLTSRFDYTALQYLDQNGATQNMPAVSDQSHLDGRGQVLTHTRYSFGLQSGGLTFTGIGIGCKLNGPTDQLMDSGDQGYRYDVMVTDLDENGQAISSTLRWFNYLHLPVTETKYLIPNQVEAYQTVYTYSIDPNEHARSPNYAQPQVIEQFHNIASSNQSSWQGLRRSTMGYDNYGELTSQVEEVFSGFAYTKTQTIDKQYFTTSLNVQMLQTETVTDFISSPSPIVSPTVRQTVNKLSGDEKTVQFSIVSFQGITDGELKPWKTFCQDYDAQGRLVKETTSWTTGASVPDGSAISCFSSTSFSYSNGVLTESKSDSSMGVTKIYYDVRVSDGPKVRRVMPLGQTEQFQYDKLGRLVQYVDGLGGVTTKVYSIGSALNAVTVTNPLGYIHRTTSDVLGRSIEESDHGDPTQPSTEPNRMLSSTTYNTLGQTTSVTDITGLVTSFKFDGLSRQIQSIDPSGNILTSSYDDQQRTVKRFLNGIPRHLLTLDVYDRTKSQTVYADVDDTSITYCIIQDTIYNGNGQKVGETISQKSTQDESPAKLLKSLSMSYDADSRMISQVASGKGDAGEDVVTRTFVYDVLGNRYTWNKETKYNDGRSFSNKGPVTLFDMHTNLTLLKDQLGNEEHNTYDQNGWHSSTTRLDGTTITYTNDAVGQPVQIRSKTNDKTMTYNAQGQIATMQYNDSAMTFEYFQDGSVRLVDYGGGSVQTYERDSFSRVKTEVDVYGTRKDISYDPLGRISSTTCQGDVVTYQYGRVNSTEGMLVSTSLDGSAPYTQEISYDGFNERSKVTTVRPDKTVLLETTYGINSQRQISSTTSSSDIRSELNKTTTWLYDGIGQVIQEATVDALQNQTTQGFTYDGNSNILSTTVTNGVGTMSRSSSSNMTYNAIDQRTDAGFQYDPNGRLIRDDAGLQYSFDDFDHLISVRTADGVRSQFQYHGDSMLAALSRPNETTEFFYTRDSHVNAVGHQTDGQAKQTSSLLRDDKSILAAYSPSPPPRYFFEGRGSTALQIAAQDSTAITYQAYGSSTSTAPLSLPSSFSFNQELTDPSSGLVYLRSRFYQPGNKSFISMDSYLLENRYAYCQGDPINYFDPSGHSCWRIIGSIIGAVLGTVVGAVTLGAATPIAATLWAAVGVSEAAVASATAAAFAGAVANVATNLTTTGFIALVGVQPFQYGLVNFGQDLLGGAAGGFVAAGVGAAVTQIGVRFGEGALTVRIAITAGTIAAGVADLSTQRAVAFAISGSPPTNSDNDVAGLMTNLVMGLMIGWRAMRAARPPQLREMESIENTAIELSVVVRKKAPGKLVWKDIQESCKKAGDWKKWNDDFDPPGSPDNRDSRMSTMASTPLLQIYK